MNHIKQQYTITEDNEYEGETFGYIMMLTEDEVSKIKYKIKSLPYCNESLSIEESSYSPSGVRRINSTSDNTTMLRLAFYEFEDENVLDNWMNFGDVFYKGTGLRLINEI